MTELPERLLSGTAGEWERSLLESATLDAPSLEFKRAFSSRLGAALGTAGVLTVSGVSHAALGMTWLKWFSIGLIVGTAGASAGIRLVEWTQRPAPSISSTAGRGRARAPQAAGAPPPNASPTAVTIVGPASASSTPSSAVGNGRPASPAALPNRATNEVARDDEGERGSVKASRLAQEMAALEIAREAIANGKSRAALRSLDDYERRFANGALAIEGRVLRIEALAASGDETSARSLARRFLDEQPGSPYAKRVASIAHPRDRAIP